MRAAPAMPGSASASTTGRIAAAIRAAAASTSAALIAAVGAFIATRFPVDGMRLAT
jgi:hypothetical protein